jgi:hypothetical protein
LKEVLIKNDDLESKCLLPKRHITIDPDKLKIGLRENMEHRFILFQQLGDPGIRRAGAANTVSQRR